MWLIISFSCMENQYLQAIKSKPKIDICALWQRSQRIKITQILMVTHAPMVSHSHEITQNNKITYAPMVTHVSIVTHFL